MKADVEHGVFFQRRIELKLNPCYATIGIAFEKNCSTLAASSPALAIIVALPAVELSLKSVKPPCEPPKKPPTVAPLLVIVALPADEVPRKRVEPACAPLTPT